MARMLSRSRSLRMLRGGHKETHQQENGRTTPPPFSAQMEFDRLKAAAPAANTDRRVDTPDMVQRPRTSGGPGDRGKLFHKKVAPVTPAPENSFPSFPLLSPSKSSTTILYTAEVHEDREGVIGIALGSPTMNPAWSASPRGSEIGTVTHISSNLALPRAVEVNPETPKPKVSRWKSIFGRKPPAQLPQAQKPSFYQLAQSVMPQRVDSHHDADSFVSRSISRAEESPNDNRFHPEPAPQPEARSPSPPIFKPEIRESRKVPKGQEQPTIATRPRALTISTNPGPGKPRMPLMRSASSPKPSLRDMSSSSPSVPQVVVSHAPRNPPFPTNSGGPLLDVDIPSIKLDRYSVMFGSLLQSNSNSNSNRSSSLLVRRQGNSERLKPLNELSVRKEGDGTRNPRPQRRATSPSYPKSPSVALSLFPQPTHNRAPSPRALSVNRPRPLQRSKTAPASSPHRQHFPTPQSSDRGVEKASQVKISREPIPETENQNLENQVLKLLEPSAPTPSSRHSFESGSEEVTIVNGASPGAPWAGEPQWELITKPSIIPKPSLVSRPSQREALRSHPAHAPLAEGPSSAPLDSRRDSPLKKQTIEPGPRSADQAAAPKPQTQNQSQSTTVGVARSVSVSRASPRSAEVVKPALIKRATEKSLSPDSGRFIDQKPLTPTLVELQNRKSHIVQLVEE